MNWFIKCGGEKATYVTDSTGKGNYKGTQGNEDKIISTGLNPAYRVNNIYDMAGNVDEWTLAAWNTTFRINRGGRLPRRWLLRFG